MTPEPVLLTHVQSSRQDDPMTEGALTLTGLPTDLGIVGKGFFLVRDTTTSEFFATRAGLFLQDGDGYLITYDGMRVQGFTDASLTISGDVRIDVRGRRPGNDPSAVAFGFSISGDGSVMVSQSNGTQFARAQVLLFGFAHPGYLVPTGYSRFSGVTDAQPRRLQVAGGVYGDGIRQGRLELINVTEDLLAIRRTLKFFSQGAHQATGFPMDFALNGYGFFIVRQPSTGTLFATRDGAFLKDEAGYLITSGGLRVQGFSDATLTQYGDIRIDGQGRPPSADPNAGVMYFNWDREDQFEYNPRRWHGICAWPNPAAGLC